MSLLFFWIKIFVNRTIEFVKRHTILAVGAITIIFAFLVAKTNVAIRLDAQKHAAITAALVFAALVVSLKSCNAAPMLIMFSKSGFMNKTIHTLFFIKRSIINNTPLLLFNLIVFKGLIAVEHAVYAPLAAAFSLLCSFLLMNGKHKFTHKKTSGAKPDKTRVHPLVKSAVYDYCTPEFLQGSVTAVSLFVVMLIELLKENNITRSADFHPADISMDNSTIVLTVLAVVLSLGFMGVVDSTHHINWRYYAIISSYGFMRHFRRTLLFLTGFFGFFIAAFIVAASFFSITAMLKCLYCMMVLMCISASVAFTTGSVFVKALTLVAAAILTIWIGGLRAYFLPTLIIPALAALIKAKAEYKEFSQN
jgi:hypothetical protein